MDRPLFIGSDIYRRTTFGAKHPLAIQRVPVVVDLCRALGWLDDSVYVESPMASPAQLARFHDPGYIDALAEAERTQEVSPERRARYNLGKLENPIHPAMFSRPATACGGSILAANLLESGGTIFSPGGGTHHGRCDRASGFCYFNDPVLAILTLLDQGLARIAYVDVDAHHGDGVEAAFAGDTRVRCISVHEAGRWPFTGLADDRAGGSARNLPVPAGMNDSEMDYIADRAILPLVQEFVPDAIVVQCGADALAEDPLSRQELSNGALWRVVARMISVAPRLLVLGGGGYNPWAVGRCWAGVWAVLNGLAFPQRLPPSAEAVLRQLVWDRAAGRNPPDAWFTTLADPPRPGPVRPEVLEVVDLALQPD